MNWNVFFAKNVAKRAIVAQAIKNDPWCHDQGLRDIYDTSTLEMCWKICKDVKIEIVPRMIESWDGKRYEPSKRLVDELSKKLIETGVTLPRYYN